MYASTPFVLDDNGHILVDMTLDGKPVTVGVDTGAPTSVMSLPAAQRLFGLGPESPGVEQDGSVGDSTDPSQKVYQHRFGSLLVGGLEVKNPMIDLIPDNFVSASHGRAHLPDLILGLKQIANLHRTSRTRRRRFILRPLVLNIRGLKKRAKNFNKPSRNRRPRANRSRWTAVLLLRPPSRDLRRRVVSSAERDSFTSRMATGRSRLDSPHPKRLASAPSYRWVGDDHEISWRCSVNSSRDRFCTGTG
jgi:hypothetical protein